MRGGRRYSILNAVGGNWKKEGCLKEREEVEGGKLFEGLAKGNNTNFEGFRFL